MSGNDKPKPSRRRAPRKPKAATDAPASSQGNPKSVTRKRKTGASDTSATGSPQPAANSPTALIRAPLSVRWRDLDAFNHVNNSKFLSYLEEARLRWMRTIPGEWLDEHVAPVIAATHVNYRRPIEWPNELVIELFVERLGNTSLTIGHRIGRADDDSVLYADGNVVMVWIDKHGGQAAPLPEAVRTACVRS